MTALRVVVEPPVREVVTPQAVVSCLLLPVLGQHPLNNLGSFLGIGIGEEVVHLQPRRQGAPEVEAGSAKEHQIVRRWTVRIGGLRGWSLRRGRRLHGLYLWSSPYGWTGH